MFKFLKRGTELVKLERAINRIYVMLDQLMPKIENSNNHSEFIEDIGIIAYVAKKGVIDRIEEFDLSMDMKIWMHPNKLFKEYYSEILLDERMTLSAAFNLTIVKIIDISREIGMNDLVENILDKREDFYKFDILIPDELKRNI